MTKLNVVFDLGGVLASESSHLADAAALLNVEPDALRQAYWDGRLAYDSGASDLEYWSAVGAAAGVDVDEEMAGRLAAQDSGLWVQLRPEAEQIVADVAAAGHPVWILTSSPSVMAEAIDASSWRPYLAGRVVSGLVGSVKPEPEIYRAVEELSGSEGSELAFIDDKQPNLDAAAERGWRTHLWRDDADTRAWLVELGVLA